MVIGNPPYISVRTKNFEASLKPTYKALYTLAVGQYDLYTLFIEFAEKVLKGHGVLAFIIPTRMLSNENFMQARQFVMDRMPIVHYVNAQRPFESANVEANIMVCKKGTKEPIISSEILDNETNHFRHVADIPFSSILQMPFNIFPFVFSQDKLDILFQIQSKTETKPLSDYLEITRGFECGYNDSRIGRGNYKFIMSESIFGYCVIQDEPMYCNPDFSKTSRYKTKETFCTVPKLLTKFCSNQIKFALDTVGYCNTNSVYNCALKSIRNEDLLYLLGILNSKLTTFWFNTAFLNIDTIFPHIQKNQLEAIPIIQADCKTKEIVISLVKSIFEHKKENLHADITHIENQIDEIVYSLYGITHKERTLIEQG